MGRVRFKMSDRFYLLDLERSLDYGRLFFWKSHKRGYTSALDQAGLYSKEMAIAIVKSDIDLSTIMISQSRVYRILGKELKPDAGTINIRQI